MKRNKRFQRLTSGLLTLALLLGQISTVAFAEDNTADSTNLLETGSYWHYLDDNTDPAQGESNRTIWTTAEFDDSGWSEGASGFGSKSGTSPTVGSGSSSYTANTQIALYQSSTSATVTSLVVTTESADTGSSGTDTGTTTPGGSTGGGSGGPPSSSSVTTHDFVEGVKDITIGMGVDETQKIFTWYDSAETSYLTISGTRYDAAQLDTTNDDYVFHKGYTVTVDDLEPNTTYTYSIGTEETVYTYKTSDYSDNSYSFLVAGDPQIGSSDAFDDGEGWTTSLDMMDDWFGMDNFDFLITLGDQINGSNSSGEAALSATEYEWDNYFANGYLTSLPNVMNVGNHENYGYTNYSANYTVPDTMDTNTVTTNSGDQSGDYWYGYEGTLFMSLNSNDSSNAEHIAFMESAVVEYAAAYGEPVWQIVTFHHSIYSSASHYNDAAVVALREGLADTFSALGIDAVLMGHDHVYTRSVMMDGQLTTANGYDAVVTDPADGEVVYFTMIPPTAPM